MSTTFLERIRHLSEKQLAVLALRLNDELEQARQAGSAPVAVIGMGCRFPGGIDGPDAYWQLLIEGRDAIREVPGERWDSDAWFDADPDAAGKMSVKLGGFLDEIAEFDPGFFGITPREAETMDPQQRLLLEVAWETLEHAGIAPTSLAGSHTGVFVGLCNTDHFQRVLSRGVDRIDAYLASGNAPSVAAGRISYTLGLQGPALTVDTACSSSLVALHLAMAALRTGGCSLALAGGVNVICAPEAMLTLSKAKMLAADGRCKAFDATADGFARGEGCGLVALKLLADAERDGDRIHAILRGSAVNHDGRSTGLTVPSRNAQESMIRSALADAGIEPSDVGYVEAHGTGTRLGDPIEMRALAAALCSGRGRSQPLIVGSAKTNFGHLESAAGIAGVLKAVLALEHSRIPPHLHFRKGNPDIDWDQIPVEIPVEARSWPNAARRIAGVSSFGFSGTNAHVVLEAAPPNAARTLGSPVRSAYCLPLSARSQGALATLAGRLSSVAGGAELYQLAATLGCGRAPQAERLAVVAKSAQGAAAALAAAATGRDDSSLRRGRVEAGVAPGVVFLCTGQGAQYPGMTRALLTDAPTFRDVVERCDAALGRQADGRRLFEVLSDGSGPDAPLHRTEWTQPALYAVECGLAALWRSWGIEPVAVIGHSAGEFAAAAIAGVFELEDGLGLVAERGRLLGALPLGGTMAAIYVTEDEARQAIVPYGETVSLAAVNARDSVVISGRADAVDAVLADLARIGVQGHRLRVSFAAHSPLVNSAVAALEEAASRVEMREPRIPVAWNLTGGRPLPTGAPDPSYWGRHLRAPVEFARGMARLREDGARIFLEVGPHPVLAAIAARDVVDGVDSPVFIGSLRRDHDDWHELAGALAELHVRGANIDWPRVVGKPRPQPLVLPTYPFERRRFWIDTTPRTTTSAPMSADPFLASPGTGRAVFETEISATSPAWLAEHVVHGSPLVAGPVYLHMAVAAAARAGITGSISGTDIEDFAINTPLRLGSRPVTVRTTIEKGEGEKWQFVIASRSFSDTTEWISHASGTLAGVPAVKQESIDDPSAIGNALGSDIAASHLDRLADLGIDLTGRFRSLARLHCGKGEAMARTALPDGIEPLSSPLADPGLLDGVLQAAGATVPPEKDALFFLTGIDRVVLAGALPRRFWCRAVLRIGDGGDMHLVDVAIYDDEGRGVGQLKGVRLTRAQPGTARRPRYFGVEWEAAPLPMVAARHLASPLRHQATLDRAFESQAAEHGLAIYDDLLPLADRIAASHVAAALEALAFDARPGRRFGVAEEMQRLGIADAHQRLFARLLVILAEDGVLALDGTAGEVGDGRQYHVVRGLSAVAAGGCLAEARARFAESAELALLERCGDSLAGVLTGGVDPLELLFPGGSFSEARALYVESAFARTYNATLAAFLRAIVNDVPSGVKLRVLEIGGGTGGSTGAVLDALGPPVDYTFTDVSPLFLQRAADRFGERQGFRTAHLDIEAEPAGQGHAIGAYDIVLAANVLHATRDLATSVAHARSLLAPGGVLAVIEGARPDRWVDLTFGLTPGWWRFADHALRPDYPLIGPEAWQRLLSAAGLSDIALVGGGTASGRGGQQMLVFARRPADCRQIRLVGGSDLLRDALGSALAARGAVSISAAVPAEDIVYLGPLGLAARSRDDDSASVEMEATAVLEPLRLLREAASGTSARLWAVTSGVHAIGTAKPAPGARWQAPLHGIGRVAALETPDAWGGLIDLDPELDLVAQTEELAETILAADVEDQCALRGGNRLVPRLREAPAPDTQAPQLDRNGTYLVTGGFGGLGAVVGRWLAEQGAGRVALLGRHPDPEGPAIQAIRAAGAEATALGANVADAAALAEALHTLDRQGLPLRGAVHAAAHFDVSPLTEFGADRVHAMFQSKVAGTIALERALRARGADFLVLFSSTTAVLGAPGFAHYAAANAFLDASVQTAMPDELRVLSIGWGTWGSMRLASADMQKTYGEQGLQPMSVAAALSALGALLKGDTDYSLVAAIDWPRLVSLHETRRPRPMLSGLGREARVSVAPAAANSGDATVQSPAAALRARLDGAPERMRREILLSFVASEAAAVMGQGRGDDVPRDRGLFEIGMDSLMSVDLRRRLERGSGLSLPATITFNHPSVAALADVLAAHLEAPSPDPAGKTAQMVARADPPVSTAQPKIPADDLDSLSDEEVAALLRERLGALR